MANKIRAVKRVDQIVVGIARSSIMVAAPAPQVS
jgi:hypothetical protein